MILSGVWLGLAAFSRPALSQSITLAQDASPRQSLERDAWQIVNQGANSIRESSGLARSFEDPDLFWTHNDSGGKPRLFLVDRGGNHVATLPVDGVRASDWEDIASYEDKTGRWLVIADCGDNNAKRSKILFHRIQAPSLTSISAAKSSTSKTLPSVTPEMTWVVKYEDGPRDCEAIVVDAAQNRLLLISKSRFGLAGLYAVPLRGKPSGAIQGEAREFSVVAKRLMTLPIPMVTAADWDHKRQRFGIAGYFQLYLYSTAGNAEPAQAANAEAKNATPARSLETFLKALPTPIDMPRLRQIEAFCFDEAGNLVVTSEGAPMPMGLMKSPSIKGEDKP
ncbi:MAG: hypothetical protein AAF958_20420 [Planctomycetota bacterium]